MVPSSLFLAAFASTLKGEGGPEVCLGTDTVSFSRAASEVFGICPGA